MITFVLRKNFRLIALYAILLMSLSSCGDYYAYVKGKQIKYYQGVETRALVLDSDFNGINLTGAFDVVYIPGDYCSVEVTTHPEVFDMIKGKLEDGILNMSLKSASMMGIETFKLTIQAPELDFISVSGACDFTAEEGIIAKTISIISSGASDIYISRATADLMAFKVSGTSDVTVDNMNVNYLDMSVAGGAGVTIKGLYTDYLGISAVGASDVTIGDLDVNYLNVLATGESDVNLAGYVNEGRVKLKGDSDLNIKELISGSLTAESGLTSTIKQ